VKLGPAHSSGSNSRSSSHELFLLILARMPHALPSHFAAWVAPELRRWPAIVVVAAAAAAAKVVVAAAGTEAAATSFLCSH